MVKIGKKRFAMLELVTPRSGDIVFEGHCMVITWNILRVNIVCVLLIVHVVFFILYYKHFQSPGSRNASSGKQPSVNFSTDIYTPVKERTKLIWRSNAFTPGIDWYFMGFKLTVFINCAIPIKKRKSLFTAIVGLFIA